MKKLTVNVKLLLLTEDIFGFNINLVGTHSFFREIDFAMEELKISIKEYGRVN
jgi:hypothetical protein